MPNPLTLHAPAKLNLALAVGPTRPDGFHPVASWMVPLTLGDTVTLAVADASTLQRTLAPDAPRPFPIDWPADRDLAQRALVTLEQHTDQPLPTRITIDKRIPPGAGLGGGSADAAAVLVGVNRLHTLNLPEAALLTLAATLGSDVAFAVHAILHRTGAVATGRGETLAPLPRRDAVPIFLALPDAHCPTAAVYAAFDAPPPPGTRASARVPSVPPTWDPTTQAARVHALASTETLADTDPFNDLAAPARAAVPALDAAWRTVHDATGRPVHVTGSGAALFLLPHDADDAATLAARINAAGVTALITHTLA